ncbi:putative glycerol-3-phosphate acyltransferase [Rhodobacteraceae bacterium THAF1]|uniref:glycerol-3-phosphate 1-O-acyltransferase PlsY n=1 Tax=Palleronia sp. THAF1 TaxID=2587842 RepID=UPI000F3FD37F|nr:glycerol-3-phosphate 1-O-acyltransferase PlsY [Palleronia sp. THAF1]QFU07157.1 putative glycerol-3-phosphate acyltransferase [Palleronia sp. THAF1]VDC16688.1 putative glycerol-3-phosphate acyltransferase [Rhodobacteraceae bacterium THAF1]
MLILSTVAAYLLGSVPFGLVITRLFGLGDLRTIGSGNIGATNVLRTGSKPAALLTLICDVGKGAFAVVIARILLGDSAGIAAGAAAFIGHCFPIYLGFKGGKGVATFLGTVLALAWPLGLITAATWLAVAAFTRISSLSALVAAAVAAPIALLLGYSWALAVALLLMAIVIFIRHAANIARIRAGTEPRIGQTR